MKKLIIIGASGHGKVIADIAVKNNYDHIFFLDDNEEIIECAGFPVIGRTNEASDIDGDALIQESVLIIIIHHLAMVAIACRRIQSSFWQTMKMFRRT